MDGDFCAAGGWVGGEDGAGGDIEKDQCATGIKWAGIGNEEFRGVAVGEGEQSVREGGAEASIRGGRDDFWIGEFSLGESREVGEKEGAEGVQRDAEGIGFGKGEDDFRIGAPGVDGGSDFRREIQSAEFAQRKIVLEGEAVEIEEGEAVAEGIGIGVVFLETDDSQIVIEDAEVFAFVAWWGENFAGAEGVADFARGDDLVEASFSGGDEEGVASEGDVADFGFDLNGMGVEFGIRVGGFGTWDPQNARGVFSTRDCGED